MARTLSLVSLVSLFVLSACGGSVSPSPAGAAGAPSGSGASGGGASAGGSATAVTAGAPGKGGAHEAAGRGGADGGSSGAPGEAGAAGAANASGGSSGAAGASGGGAAYDGKGFVVHEWGTNTVVVGSDGAMLRGLHHEQEDLPSFVYDRIKAGGLPGSTSVIEKMETPVTYFYAPTTMNVTAKVGFPAGVLTQWYPAVQSFAPGVARVFPPAGPSQLLDPVLDPKFPFVSQQCAAKFASVQGGLLDWGTLTLLAPGETAPMPEASLDSFTWSYARDVQSNVVQLNTAQKDQQHEKFLFYRGLGAFPLPWTVTAKSGGGVSLANPTKQALGAAFVLNVGAERGAFHAHLGGVTPGATLDDLAPSLDGAPLLADYVDALAASVTTALDASGLYHDESVAMVRTWKAQWFRTPGVRVLYLMPASAIDDQIPLTITPKPDATVRVMMMRVEVISPELEAADVAAAKSFEGDSVAAEAYFAALGRFAEPRLRRAIALGASPGAAVDYLAKIATANTSDATGE
jgi:hypothetical protein